MRPSNDWQVNSLPTKVSRDLVVDTSVARSAGGEGATFPTSKNCRDCLKSITLTPHCVVMSQPIMEEWNKHKSVFSSQWLVAMFARKRVTRIKVDYNDAMRRKLQEIASNQKDADAMLKDCHLIEAALATDGIIIARDEEVRALFSASCQLVGQMKNIMWVNPDELEEEVVSWLEAGARPDAHRMLGS